MAERSVFTELMEGLNQIADHQAGKITLRTHKMSLDASRTSHKATIAPEELKSVREKLHLSQAVFARYLQTGESTYQNWEQGRARPNTQAVLLIRMVERNPDTLLTLASL